VSTYLARARRKLEAGSRADLQRRVFGPMVELQVGQFSGLLTDTEMQIVRDILGGLPNAAIARKRGRSVRTVENQVSGLFRKLHIGSRFELWSRLQRLIRRQTTYGPLPAEIASDGPATRSGE
jgi:DNA-binding CsgD family transcriptional regulator